MTEPYDVLKTTYSTEEVAEFIHNTSKLILTATTIEYMIKELRNGELNMDQIRENYSPNISSEDFLQALEQESKFEYSDKILSCLLADDFFGMFYFDEAKKSLDSVLDIPEELKDHRFISAYNFLENFLTLKNKYDMDPSSDISAYLRLIVDNN